MRGILDQQWFIIPVALFLGVGLVMAWIVPYGDEILLLNSLRHEPFISIFKFFSWCGETWVWVIVGLAALFWRYRFTLLIAMTGLIMPFVYVIKDQVGIDRPITYFRSVEKEADVVVVPDIELNTGQTSFPSGHTMSAFGLYSLLALMAGRRFQRTGLLLAILAIGAGVARIFLVQHFLIDVLAGAVLGMLVSGFVWWLNGRPYFQGKTKLDGNIRCLFGAGKMP